MSQPLRHLHEHGRARAAEPEVPLAVVGVDFRVASTTWRNCLLLSAEERADLTEGLRRSCAVEGLVVLETCNRVEWILAAAQPRWAAEVLRAQMQDRWVRAGLANSTGGLPVPYLRVGPAAVSHILRVAVGLESFVVGEREIAGQLNRSVVEARRAGHASPLLNALQTAVGRTVRKVQRLTRWRHHARGVHGLALEAATRALPALADRKRIAVVVGMGEIGRKAATLFQTSHWRVVRVNRTVPTERIREWHPLATLPEHLHDADALIVATGAHLPVVDLAGVARALVVIDLGAPPQVDAPADVAILGLDELLALPSARPQEADEQTVLELVGEGVAEFLLECRKRDLATLLRAAHDAYDRACYEELPALLQAELGDDPERKRRLHAGLRDLLRTYARDIVQHIEAAAQVRERPRALHRHDRASEPGDRDVGPTHGD
jgi:glutamyl-tRNA reductase